MTFDPEGTQPGLNPAVEEKKPVISMRCRVDKCDSKQVHEISQTNNNEHAGMPHNRIYRCIKCGHSWSASVGGHVNL